VFSFNVETTDELLTANARLTLFGEFIRGIGLNRWLAAEMPNASLTVRLPRDTKLIPRIISSSPTSVAIEPSAAPVCKPPLVHSIHVAGLRTKSHTGWIPRKYSFARGLSRAQG